MHGQAQQRPPLTQAAKQRAVRQQRAEAFVDQHPRRALAGHQAHQRVERHRALGERCARHAGLRRATPRARAGPRPSSGALRRRSARPRGVGWLSAQRSRRSNGCRRALSSRSRKRAINWAINSESPPAPKKSCSTPSDGLSSTSRQSASSAFSSSSAGACATPCRRSAWGWRAKPVRALRSILPLPVTGRRSSTRNCAGSM